MKDMENEEIPNIIRFKVFFRIFLKVIYVVRNIISTLLLFIFLMGILLGYIEGIGIGNGIYFAFVSALTLGYGDIVPHTILGKIIAVFILPITGMLITGIIVAAAINAIDRGLRESQKDRRNS